MWINYNGIIDTCSSAERLPANFNTRRPIALDVASIELFHFYCQTIQ